MKKLFLIFLSFLSIHSFCAQHNSAQTPAPKSLSRWQKTRQVLNSTPAKVLFGGAIFMIGGTTLVKLLKLRARRLHQLQEERQKLQIDKGRNLCWMQYKYALKTIKENYFTNSTIQVSHHPLDDKSLEVTCTGSSKIDKQKLKDLCEDFNNFNAYKTYCNNLYHANNEILWKVNDQTNKTKPQLIFIVPEITTAKFLAVFTV